MNMHQLYYVLVLAFAISIDVTGGCPDCEDWPCPKDLASCGAGVVEDICGCCEDGVCGRLVNEECYNKTLLNDDSFKKYGLCGEHLNCVYNEDPRWDMHSKAICVCGSTEMVCGSNNETYINICELNEKSVNLRNTQAVIIKHWGACISKPVIITGPKDMTVKSASRISLTCETKGNPTPLITWEFIPSSGKGKVYLPTDDINFVVQSRGGPDKKMLTSWLSVIMLDKAYEGIYTCVVTNDEGSARASATLKIQ